MLPMDFSGIFWARWILAVASGMIALVGLGVICWIVF